LGDVLERETVEGLVHRAFLVADAADLDVAEGRSGSARLDRQLVLLSGVGPAAMDPVHVGEVGDMAAGADGDEPRRDEWAIAVVAFVRVLEAREFTVAVESSALLAVVPAREPHNGDVGTFVVAGWRDHESTNLELSCQPRLVEIRVGDGPAVDSGHHER